MSGSEFGAPSSRNRVSSSPSLQDLTLREREMDLRQRELAIREQEYMAHQHRMQRGPRPSIPGGGVRYANGDEMTKEDYFGRQVPLPSDVDMVAFTAQRNRRTSSFAKTKNTDPALNGVVGGAIQRLIKGGRKQSMVSDPRNSSPAEYYESFIGSALVEYTSDRYGGVDTRALTDSSRVNSISSNAPRPSLYPQSQSMPVLSPPMMRKPTSTLVDSAPQAPPNTRFKYMSSPRAMQQQQQQQQYMPPQMQARQLSSMAGPAPMELMSAAYGSSGPMRGDSQQRPGPSAAPGESAMAGPSSQAQQPTVMLRRPELNGDLQSDAELYRAAAAVGGKDIGRRRRRSLTGSASASASTSNDNGSGHSSSASSLEQK